MPSGVDDHQRASKASVALALAWLALACEPTVVIGSCSEASGMDAGQAGASAAVSAGMVATPWSTGFEDGLCGYHAVEGYCYARHEATLEIVRSPVRSGKFAAAFSVNGNATMAERSQTRCVRQGAFPKSAYYGAWYLVPAVQISDGNWNLFHFLGGVPDGETHALWDISLANNSDGALELAVFNFFDRRFYPATTGVPPIPIGSWFHIEIQLKRSAQANGEVIVYQDGVPALHLTNLITDDTEWGQWYVGNYAKTLVPTLSTVYVDDVTIREEP